MYSHPRSKTQALSDADYFSVASYYLDYTTTALSIMVFRDVPAENVGSLDWRA